MPKNQNYDITCDSWVQRTNATCDRVPSRWQLLSAHPEFVKKLLFFSWRCITSNHRIRKSVRRNLWGLKASISVLIVYCIFVEGVKVAFHNPMFTWKQRFKNFTCWPGWRQWMACFSLTFSTMILKTEPQVGNLRNTWIGNISGSTHKRSLSDLLWCPFARKNTELCQTWKKWGSQNQNLNEKTRELNRVKHTDLLYHDIARWHLSSIPNKDVPPIFIVLGNVNNLQGKRQNEKQCQRHSRP